MKPILWVLLGAGVMFLLLKITSKISTGGDSAPALKNLLKTQQFANLVKTNEARELIKTTEFRNFAKTMAEEQAVAFAESLIK